ncbi:SH3 and cysteine rich domain 2 [Basidiobolus ranarum]|uniref:SH3 and cysteine rich domain 2 n=1 Tax=Basidiobolus ranarum TaxID=34480 RepID=A0ABR2WLK5_9FUNG
MKYTSLIVSVFGAFFCAFFCLTISTTVSSGVVRTNQCLDISCQGSLLRRGHNDDDENSHDDDDDDDSNSDDDSGEGDDDDDDTHIKPTPTRSTTSTINHHEGSTLHTPTPAISTLWDEEGNAFVFSSHLLIPTISTVRNENGASVIITPTPSIKTLWDEDGNEVTYTSSTVPISEPTELVATEQPTNIGLPVSQPTDAESIEQPTNIGVPVDQPTDSGEIPSETSAPVPETKNSATLSSLGSLDADNNGNSSTSNNPPNFPVIIGGSIGALVLVIGIGGFVGYRFVNNRRQAKWLPSEQNRDTKGFSDLKEVTEIAANSPGMNTAMPFQHQSVISTVPPLIIRQSFVSTQSSIPSPVPLAIRRNSANSGLYVPSFAHPARSSTQSSVGVRESVLEETFIVGFTDFEEPPIDTNISMSTNIPNIAIEEPLFVMTALLPFMPQRPNEMLVQSGDEIVITEEVGEEWLGGYNQSRDPNTKGYFPRTCVTGTKFM